MKLSAKSRCGTRLLLELAINYGKGPTQVGDISKRQNISVKYLEQLVRPLKKANLIVSARGPKGGHMLAKKPQEITLGHIIRIFEHTGDIDETELEKNDEIEDYHVKIAWNSAIDALFTKLDNTTIEDLLNESKKQILLKTKQLNGEKT